MPVRVLITDGTTADCTQVSTLIEGIDADYLLADRGYDSDAIVAQAQAQGITAVIPPRKTANIYGSMTKHSTLPVAAPGRECFFISEALARCRYAMC